MASGRFQILIEILIIFIIFSSVSKAPLIIESPRIAMFFLFAFLWYVFCSFFLDLQCLCFSYMLPNRRNSPRHFFVALQFFAAFSITWILLVITDYWHSVLFFLFHLSTFSLEHLLLWTSLPISYLGCITYDWRKLVYPSTF